jgi:hypothetical protein
MSKQSTSLIPEAPQASRRALLMGFAAAATPMAPALANALSESAPAVAMPSEPDPVYAAIKHERDVYAEYCATDAIQSQIGDEDPCPLKLRQGRAPSDRSLAKHLARPDVQAWLVRYREAENEHSKSCKQLFGAREAFLQTQPTTVAGLVAYLDHVEGPISTGSPGEAWWDEIEKELAFPTLAAAARKLIVGQA